MRHKVREQSYVHPELRKKVLGLIRFRRRQMKGGYDGTDGRRIEEAAAAA